MEMIKAYYKVISDAICYRCRNTVAEWRWLDKK